MHARRSRIHKPSPAMVVALLALVVATGGSSYAAGVRLSRNTVLSDNIKNGEVKRSDLAKDAVASPQVADGSLLAVDFKSGELKTGPQGPQGVAGPQGPKGDTGISTLAVRAASGTGTVTASCQPGERATGGGAHSVEGVIVGSAPVADPLAFFAKGPVPYQGYTPTSWTARAQKGSADADVTAWVVCASG